MEQDEVITKMTPAAFDEVFWSECKNTKTYKEAFNKANDYHLENYGSYRYSCWNSYRITKSRRFDIRYSKR